MRLRTRLMLLIAGLGAALVVLSFGVVERLFAAHALAAARREIAATELAFGHMVTKSLDGYAIQARIVADETIVKEALINNDGQLAFTHVDSARDRTGAVEVLLRRNDGGVLADVTQRHASGTRPLPEATSGSATGFINLGNQLVAAAVAEVRLGDRTLGTMLVGSPLSEPMLAEVAGLSGAEVTVLAGTAQPMSTLGSKAAGEVERLADGCSPGLMGHAVEVTVAERPYMMSLAPLDNIAGERIGCFAITRSLEAEQRSMAAMQRWLLLIGVAITLLGVGMAFVLSRRVVAPMQALTNASLRIAAGELGLEHLPEDAGGEVGDLQRSHNRMLVSLRAISEAAERMARRDLTGRLELEGEVGASFNRMLEHERSVVGQISKSSVQLAAAGVEIYAAAGQQEAVAAHQAAGVEEVRRTTQSLLESANHIADFAKRVLATAETAHQTVTGVAARMADLSGHTARISELLEVIRSIGDRSDLVSLNASLEATRAGESGRAFALVAAEMKRLAERVGASVHTVKALLDDIRASETGVATALDESRQLSDSATESARQITRVTQQQRSATEQVLESMEHISSVLAEAVAAAHESRTSAGVLKDEAERLATIVARFRLDAPAPHSDAIRANGSAPPPPRPRNEAPRSASAEVDA